MCCLFGLISYNSSFTSKDKNTIISVLSAECEERGIDATGIAYNTGGVLRVYKKALPAHKLHYTIPSTAQFIMGHTRMTTQGSEKQNRNNHPFIGSVKSNKFALAHNGVLYNDRDLRKSEKLPHTRIETDSYVSVQLIEKQRTLNFKSLKLMAEKVEGSFTFTVIDSQDNLYIVKGSNPFCLYNFPNMGFYLYASTDEILIRAIIKLGMHNWQKEKILASTGEILKINRYGAIERGNFDSSEAYEKWYYKNYMNIQKEPIYQDIIDNDYLENLKSVASYYGYSPSDIELLAKDGFSCEEIEDMLYMSYF